MKSRIYLLLALLVVAAFGYAQNNAVNFDGVDDHVQIASGLGITNTFTAEAWIYPTNLGGTGDLSIYGRTVLSNSAASGSYPLWLTVFGTEARVWTWESTATAYTPTVGAGLTVNQWFHLAVTSTQGGNTTVYVNGIPKLSYTNDGETTWNPSFTIGAIRPTRPTTNIPFAGIIDEVRVWNVVRTPSEILASMNIEISPVPASLVGYWKFNEPSGTLAADSGSPAQNGTLGSGAYFTPSTLTLPVELSSFTATVNALNYVVLNWTTQSETNLAGYNILRNSTNDLSGAIRVNPVLIPSNNTTGTSSYSFRDQEVLPGYWYYWLQIQELDGTEDYSNPVGVLLTTTDVETPGVELHTELLPVYPNPFSPSTYISYNIGTKADVVINIYNTKGQLVRTLNEQNRMPGNYTTMWDGKDSNGSSCTNGIYLIRMKAGEVTSSVKAMLMK